MANIRIAIIGAGMMAKIRTKALLDTGQVTLCGVAALHRESATAFAHEFNIPFATANYPELLQQQPDAILIELPHQVQDQAALWALDHNLDLFIGGPLASNVAVGKEINILASAHQRVVECGYECRYKACWQFIMDALAQRTIGDLCMIDAVALWPAPEESWYYQQQASGGMPLTHMSYAFLNPLCWLLGEPLYLSAFANQIKQRHQGAVAQESAIVKLEFPGKVLVSLTAGYVAELTETRWQLDILGTQGVLELHPGELDGGWVRSHNRQGPAVRHDFPMAANGFKEQAETFVAAVQHRISTGKISGSCCKNPPYTAIRDILLAEAIVNSASSYQVIKYPLN